MAAAHEAAAGARLLKHRMVQSRVGAQGEAGELRAQMCLFAGIEVLLDQREFGALTQLDEVAHVPGNVPVRRGADEQQAQRRGDPGSGGHAQHRAIVGEGTVEARERVARLAEVPREGEAQRLRILGQRARQRLHAHPGRQRVERGKVRAESAVDEHQHGSVDARQRHRGRVDRTTGRLRVAGGEAALRQRAQRGVFPRFHARVRQAGIRKGLEVLATRLVQPGNAAGRQRRVGQRGDERRTGRLVHAEAPAGSPCSATQA